MTERQPRRLSEEELRLLLPGIDGAIQTREADLKGLDEEGMILNRFTLRTALDIAREIGQWQGVRDMILVMVGDLKLEDLEIGKWKGQLILGETIIKKLSDPDWTTQRGKENTLS